MENYQKLIPIMEKSGGVMTTQELIATGWSKYHIKKMVEKGLIERIKRGLYRTSEVYTEEYFEILKVVPRGVICLFSSAMLHELTTFIPREYQISIPKNKRILLPRYPPIKLYYWHHHQYSLGIEKVRKNGRWIDVYDKEKTVCDFVKFRNKVGIDSMKEVLKTYLSMRRRNISKLIQYSKKLKIYSIIDKYLEVLI